MALVYWSIYRIHVWRFHRRGPNLTAVTGRFLAINLTGTQRSFGLNLALPNNHGSAPIPNEDIQPSSLSAKKPPATCLSRAV